MGRSRYKFGAVDAPHFLTDSVVNWLRLFSFPPHTQIILDSFSYLRERDGLKLYGYVIMEDHIHWLASHDNLPRAVSRFKSFTARNIIDHMRENGPKHLLLGLAEGKKANKTNSDRQLWQEGSHPQMIQSPEMLRQKLNYLHHNPVRRGYVEEPRHWRYSSARNYEDRQGLIEIDRIC